jgi:hypothetical protein
MVSKTKAVKDALKGEWGEIKSAVKTFGKGLISSKTDIFGQPELVERYRKSIKKQQRTESRLSQRTGNKYMNLKNTWKNPD